MKIDEEKICGIDHYLARLLSIVIGIVFCLLRVTLIKALTKFVCMVLLHEICNFVNKILGTAEEQVC